VTDTASDLKRQTAEMLGWWRQHGHAAMIVFDRVRASVHRGPGEDAVCIVSEDAPGRGAARPTAVSDTPAAG
jgi:hypothetical protein